MKSLGVDIEKMKKGKQDMEQRIKEETDRFANYKKMAN
jgi:hypothetical protein